MWELLAMLGGALIGGIGDALGFSEKQKAEKEKIQQKAMGPIRGGSSRAGFTGGQKPSPSPMPQTTLEKLGQITTPTNPVYGDMPLDLNQAQKPKPFGTGFSSGYNLNKVPRRFG